VKFLTVSLALAAVGASGEARAQTAEELNAARALFAEGLKDESQKRFADALEKFKRVQQVKDTVPVRYRIGSAYEGLNKPVQAIDAYQGCVQMGESSPNDKDVVAAARARIEALEPKIAHLAMTLPADAPADAEVQVDGETVPRERLGDVRLNSGSHVVTAKATDARPFKSQVTLSEGGRVELPIILAKKDAPLPAPPPPLKGDSSLKTIGLVSAIVGGALIVGGGVALIVRQSDISELKKSCPDGNCPVSRQSELQSRHDRAVTLGPLGITLGAVGIVAVGAGLTLFFTQDGGGVTMGKTF
jgi:hypothetical protein